MMALGSDGGSMLTTQRQAGLCNAVSDLTVAERPGRDVEAAEAELGVSMIVSGRRLLLARTEIRSVLPHAMKNDGELAGDRDLRLFESDGLGQPHTPGFQA